MLVTAHCNRLTLANMRPTTVTARAQTLRAFEKSLGGRQLGEATRLDVEAFLARPLSPASRKTYLTHLRGFYAWAVEEQYVATDPTVRLPTIRVPKGEPRPIDAEHLTKAVRRADPRMRAWLLLMAHGGLRCMEVAGLRPQDLLETEGGVLLFLVETKGGGTGSVPAHPEILAALADVPIRSGLWWDVEPRTVSRAVNVYLRTLGIESTAHALRHWSGSSWYHHSDHDLLAVKRLMRHKSVQSTEIYVGTDPTRPAEVVNLVPRLRAV